MHTFYHYPKCSTCRRASRWLEERNIEFDTIHIVESPPTKSELERLWKMSGLKLKRFFNTSGGSYRSLNLKDSYDALSDDERLELLAGDGMLIKRPILATKESVVVGFKESDYEDVLG